MATGSRRDPLLQYNFLLEVEGGIQAGFTTVSGLDRTSETVEYREGSDPAHMKKLQGLQSFSNISLKRGFTTDLGLWEWRETVNAGQTERRAGSITLLDEAREPVLRFNFVEGWICKWTGPQLDSSTNEPAIEEVEICHEGLVMESA